MLSPFGRILTLAICIALPLTASFVCPCQVGERFSSAVAASDETDNPEDKECCLCQAGSDAGCLCRPSLSEQKARPTAIVRTTRLLVSSRTGKQSITALSLAGLPLLDLMDIQVLLE